MVAYGLSCLAVLILLAIIADRGFPNALESLGFILGRALDWLKRILQTGLFGLADRMRERRLRIEMQHRSVRDSLQ